jgi:hypothetical protein
LTHEGVDVLAETDSIETRLDRDRNHHPEAELRRPSRSIPHQTSAHTSGNWSDTMKVAREERGVGVLVGADSGAGGGYGSASANAGFGVLHAFDTAGMDAPAPGSNFYPNAWIHSEASIGYVDGFAVTTTETVRVTSAIRGG